MLTFSGCSLISCSNSWVSISILLAKFAVEKVLCSYPKSRDRVFTAKGRYSRIVLNIIIIIKFDTA